jgi:hypothetical protein
MGDQTALERKHWGEKGVRPSRGLLPCGTRACVPLPFEGVRHKAVQTKAIGRW